MRLYHQEMGTGFPVILMHGFPFNHSIFRETAILLSQSARVILPDLRGFGKSHAADIEINLKIMAADIRQLMDELGMERAVMVGHSMGGYVGLEFCRQFSHQTAGLVMIASHTAADSAAQRQARLDNIQRIKNGQTREYLLEGMLPKLTRSKEVMDALEEMMVTTPEATLIAALQAMTERVDGTDWLRKSGIPNAVICGELDQILPLEKALEIAALTGADPVVKIASAGHMPMMENPLATAEGTLNFLKKIAR